MSNFEKHLADFAQKGNRYNLLPSLTASGRASGMNADEIIERARALGIHDRDGDIRRLWNGSRADPTRRPASWRNRHTPAPYLTKAEREEYHRKGLDVRLRQFVPVTLRDYEKTIYTRHVRAEDYGEIINSPEAKYLEMSCADIHAMDAARQLRKLFRRGELIWAGTIIQDETVRDRLGVRRAKTAFDGKTGVVEAHTLAHLIETGELKTIPTHVSLNPVTGKSSQTSGSSPSFDCAATIAAYRHVIVEWDKLFDIDAEGVKVPSRAHIEIVAGLLDYADGTGLIKPICAVYTGGKSIHVVLRVKATTLGEYKAQTAKLRDVLTSADDETFRADPTGWDNGYTHVRLAGATRPETGRTARLLW